MVITLLAKLVAIYVRFSILQVAKMSLKRTLLSSLVSFAISFIIYEDFYKLVEVCIGVLGRCKSRCGRRNRRGHERMRFSKNKSR